MQSSHLGDFDGCTIAVPKNGGLIRGLMLPSVAG